MILLLTTFTIGIYIASLIFGLVTYLFLKIFNLKTFYGNIYPFKSIFTKGYKSFFEPYSITSSPEFKSKFNIQYKEK
jgi:hypothetical protein